MNRTAAPTSTGVKALLAFEILWVLVTALWWYRLFWPRIPQPPFPDNSGDAWVDLWMSVALGILMVLGSLCIPVLVALSLRKVRCPSSVSLIAIVIGGLALAQLLFLVARLLGWVFV